MIRSHMQSNAPYAYECVEQVTVTERASTSERVACTMHIGTHALKSKCNRTNERIIISITITIPSKSHIELKHTEHIFMAYICPFSVQPNVNN